MTRAPTYARGPLTDLVLTGPLGLAFRKGGSSWPRREGRRPPYGTRIYATTIILFQSDRLKNSVILRYIWTICDPENVPYTYDQTDRCLFLRPRTMRGTNVRLLIIVQKALLGLRKETSTKEIIIRTSFCNCSYNGRAFFCAAVTCCCPGCWDGAWHV